MGCLLLGLCAILSVALPASSQGLDGVETVTVYSNIIAASSFKNRSPELIPTPSRTVTVIVPPRYLVQRSERYPVVYFLHGSTVDQSPYVLIGRALQVNMGINNIPDVIQVFPNGTVPLYPSSMWTDGPVNGNFSSFITDELVAYIDSNYRTIAAVTHRFIAGHSAGAYGALSIGLQRPDLFSGMMGLSGPYDWDVLESTVAARILSENAPYSDINITHGTYTSFIYQAAAVFSPDLNNTQDNFVDFPFFRNGTTKEYIYDLWEPYSITNITVRSYQNTRDCLQSQRFYVDVGTQDDYSFQMTINPLARVFNDSGVTYVASFFDGGHSNRLPFQMNDAYQWLQSNILSQSRRYVCTTSRGSINLNATGSSVTQAGVNDASRTVLSGLFAVSLAVLAVML